MQDTCPYDVCMMMYKYELYITKEPVIIPLKHNLLLPERYCRGILSGWCPANM